MPRQRIRGWRPSDLAIFMRKCRGVSCTLRLENCLARKGEARRATVSLLSHRTHVFVVLTPRQTFLQLRGLVYMTTTSPSLQYFSGNDYSDLETRFICHTRHKFWSNVPPPWRPSPPGSPSPSTATLGPHSSEKIAQTQWEKLEGVQMSELRSWGLPLRR